VETHIALLEEIRQGVLPQASGEPVAPVHQFASDGEVGEEFKEEEAKKRAEDLGFESVEAMRQDEREVPVLASLIRLGAFRFKDLEI